MNPRNQIHSPPQQLGIAIGRATAVASAVGWMLLTLLSGSFVPRSTVVATVFAVFLAVEAYKAAQTSQVWILVVAATYGVITPTNIGNAPIIFRYLGVLAVGYAVAALLLSARRTAHHHVG